MVASPANITLPVVSNAASSVVVGTGKLHGPEHAHWIGWIGCIHAYLTIETKVGDAVPLLSIHIAGSIALISAVAWERRILYFYHNIFVGKYNFSSSAINTLQYMTL